MSCAQNIRHTDDLKKCLDSFRPLNPAQLRKLQGAWDIEYTYESNRIEGNTLTLQETGLVISEGITIGGKRLNEHLEAINHQEAIDYIRALANGQSELNEFTLNSIHALILRGVDQENAGKYRAVPVTVSGAKHVPPQPFLVPKLMEDLFVSYGDKKSVLHPVQLAAQMHERLVTIHPYVDGNGRTSRLLMNLILLQHGYPIANISADQRIAYYNALEKPPRREDRESRALQVPGDGFGERRRRRGRKGALLLRTDQGRLVRRSAGPLAIRTPRASTVPTHHNLGAM